MLYLLLWKENELECHFRIARRAAKYLSPKPLSVGKQRLCCVPAYRKTLHTDRTTRRCWRIRSVPCRVTAPPTSQTLSERSLTCRTHHDSLTGTSCWWTRCVLSVSGRWAGAPTDHTTSRAEESAQSFVILHLRL